MWDGVDMPEEDLGAGGLDAWTFRESRVGVGVAVR